MLFLGLRKTEFGEQELIVILPMLANDDLFSVTNNLLFILSKSATLKQEIVITCVFVAQLSSLCSADAAYEGLGSCVCYSHRVSCPSPGRKPKQAARVGNLLLALLLAGCCVGLSNTQLSVISNMQNK